MATEQTNTDTTTAGEDAQAPARELPLLTSSRVKSYRACPRQHYFRYVLGYRPIYEPEARQFGTHMHCGWEQYWLARMRGASSEERFLAAVKALPRDMDPYLLAKAEAMMVGYTDRWDRIEFEVLAVEKEFIHPLINPETGAKSRTFRRAGKMDVVGRLPDGRGAVIEHKTSSEDTEPGSVYRQKLVLDSQVSEYFDGGDSVAKEVGLKQIDVCVYDISSKPMIRPYKATPEEERKYKQPKTRACAACKKKNSEPGPHFDEKAGVYCSDGIVVTDPGGELYANQRERDETPGEYFDRCIAVISEEPNEYYQQIEVVRIEEERNEYLFDVWQYAGLIRESERLGRAPKNPSSCFLYNTPCDYWGPCTGMSSINDPYKFRRLTVVNEELSTGKTHAAQT